MLFCMSVRLLYFCVNCVFLCSFSTLILLVGSFDLLNRLPVTCTVSVETLNLAQSIGAAKQLGVPDTHVQNFGVLGHPRHSQWLRLLFTVSLIMVCIMYQVHILAYSVHRTSKIQMLRS